MTDYTKLLTSEYAQQPDFIATVQLTSNAIGDIAAAIQSLPGLFDLDNAIQAQLNVDGQWIGFSRTVGGVLLVDFFGFADDSSALGFGELTSPSVGGRFYELGEDTSTTATLQDPEYKLLLRAKILQNQWDGSAAQFEAAIQDVIAQPTTVIDPGTLVVLIAPQIAIDPVLQQLLINFDILPRAAGIRYQYVFPLALPFVWSTSGTAVANGQTVTKPTGSAAWDSAAWMAIPSSHIVASWTVPTNNNNFMAGLATNPSGSPNFPSLNYGIQCGGSQFFVYEGGIYQGVSGSYNAGDSFAVYYDGKEAVYLHNQLPFKTTIGAPGALSPMFCLNSTASEATNIQIWTG